MTTNIHRPPLTYYQSGHENKIEFEVLNYDEKQRYMPTLLDNIVETYAKSNVINHKKIRTQDFGTTCSPSIYRSVFARFSPSLVGNENLLYQVFQTNVN